jgi:endonuclease/exonuclease/phosphatase family metal-dependent hydrolase
VSLATWNLENYSLENRMTPDGYRKQYPKPEVQKTALRKTLLGLGADILLVQEMGDARFASELQRDLRRDGADYPHVRVMGDGPRNLAVFSKKAFETRPHPVVEFSLNGKTERLRRGLLEVFFPDEGLTVFVVHLKSRWTVDAADPRAARFRLGEAIAARDLVLKKFPEPADARFLIAGDFNDWGDRLAPLFVQQLGLYEVFSHAPRSHGGELPRLRDSVRRLSNALRGLPNSGISVMERNNQLGMDGSSRLLLPPPRTFPAVFPWFRLDRIYQRGFAVRSARVLRGREWARLSDHSPLLAELELP